MAKKKQTPTDIIKLELARELNCEAGYQALEFILITLQKFGRLILRDGIATYFFNGYSFVSVKKGLRGQAKDIATQIINHKI